MKVVGNAERDELSSPATGGKKGWPRGSAE